MIHCEVIKNIYISVFSDYYVSNVEDIGAAFET